LKSDDRNGQDGQPATAKFRGDFSIFQVGGSRHLGFLKFHFLTVGRVRTIEVRHLAKLRCDRSNRR